MTRNRPEAALNEYLKKKIPGRVVRVENSLPGEAGTPDIWFATAEMEGWIESKIHRSGVTLLRREQYAWHVASSLYGAKCFTVSLDPLTDILRVWQCRHGQLQVEKAKKEGYVVIREVPLVRCNKKDFFFYLLTENH